MISTSNDGEQLDDESHSQLAAASITQVLSTDEELDLLELTRCISSGEEDEDEDEDEDEGEGEYKVRFLLRLDLRFYSNYFFTLRTLSWWRISPQDLDLLPDTVTENRRSQRYLSLSIEDHHLHPNNDRVSVSEEKLLVWKEQLVQNYSVLLNAKPEAPPSYISYRNLAEFITNICRTTIDMLRYRDDLDDDQKQLLLASQANLRFLKAYVLLADNEGMGSLLNCIQDYTCKVEVSLFSLWTGKRRDRLPLTGLEQGVVNVDKPCSLLIILDVFKLSKKILVKEGWCWGDEPSGGGLEQELEGGIQLLHERLMFLASFLEDLSLDMRLLFIRATASLGFICVFSFEDPSSEVIKQSLKVV